MSLREWIAKPLKKRRKLVGLEMEQANEYEENDVFDMIIGQFDGDIDAIHGTMDKLEDAINGLEDYSDLEEESKQRLEVVMERLLDAYWVVIEEEGELKSAMMELLESEFTI